METVRFLRDLEDEEAYAKGLELAYLDAFNAITDVGNRMYRDTLKPSLASKPMALDDRHQQLRTVLFTMALVIRDCSDRRRRLADAAVGLTDRVLDEQST